MSKGVALQKAQVICPLGGLDTVRQPVELPSTGVKSGSKPYALAPCATAGEGRAGWGRLGWRAGGGPRPMLCARRS